MSNIVPLGSRVSPQLKLRKAYIDRLIALVRKIQGCLFLLNIMKDSLIERDLLIRVSRDMYMSKSTFLFVISSLDDLHTALIDCLSL